MKSVSTIFFRTTIMLLALFFSAQQFLRAEETITLSVDAREAPRNILHAQEAVAVHPGALTLIYAEWIPGEHGPTGPVVDVAGLKISANGKAISWRRDLVDMYAIHCTVPSGVSTLDVAFDFILPTNGQYSSGASATADLLVLSWNQVILYPSAPNPHEIMVTPSLTLPEGWKFATALTTKEQSGNVIHFSPAPLNMLVDSPVLSGVHLRRIDLTPASGVPHFLDIASDDDAAIDMSPELIKNYKNLVVEANALFGAHHYNHYDFLYTLSDYTAHFGLEHHQSSDDRLGEQTLLNSDFQRAEAALLPHEFVHSWNGKYRRPAGLATGDFSKPMTDDLLWVYEGLTQYLGKILTARSGLWTPEEYREDLAYYAAWLDTRPGRTWRPLQDAADEASLLYNARNDWDSWRRGTDFYNEGDLIWLEADVTIRSLTKGKKSLDDFCKKFHGGESTGPVLKPYTFDDVVAALNSIAPYDWKAFFISRLESLSPHAPMGGIEKGGWKLVYKDTPSDMQKGIEEVHNTSDFRFSIGLMLKSDGTIQDVIPGTAAAKAGLGPGMRIVAVNGRQYSKDLFREALKKSTTTTTPIEVLAANGEFYKTYAVDYHGGERYPYLERDSSKPDVLSEIIRATAN
jgi:predicted metalloprotease with PDZ domain